MSKEIIRIVWDESSKEQWTGLLSRVDNSCYLHAWGYGEAVQRHSKMFTRRGIIYRSVTPIGLVQAFQSKKMLGIHTETIVMRGPQWIEKIATESEKLKSLSLLKTYFDTGITSSFRIQPEIEDSPHNRQLLKTLGFHQVEDGQTTRYLDLTRNLKQIQSGLKKEWVDCLKNAEKRDFNITFSDDFRSLEWILEKHTETVKKHKIDSPSADFIRCFLANNEKPLFVAKIVVVEPFLAGALIVTHGLSATYLLGWSSEEGIEKNVSHLLLWKSIERLQSMGIQSLDIGGIDMKNAYGISALKEGLSIQPKLLVGSYT